MRNILVTGLLLIVAVGMFITFAPWAKGQQSTVQSQANTIISNAITQ
ncbi:hypothetical protein LLE49_25810 [Alicyclobacillus tolerans]|nr:hypothetical protein [Alicyclobacillus tolerans]MCF8568145.1 hypothetical protein [Alicyclobacillus tolerans]